MAQQLTVSVENNFTKGLITESTGLNFPENAATDASNCEFTLIGDTKRRLGINFEEFGKPFTLSTAGKALSSYVWNNAGGSGTSRLYVRQVGSALLFYNIAVSLSVKPLSTNLINGSITISDFVADNNVFDATKECTFADGNGFLIVVHPSCEPFYVAFDPINLTFVANFISINIRDFVGVNEPQYQNANSSVRPNTLTAEHLYNLLNQGWTLGNPWSQTSSSAYTLGSTGSVNFQIAGSLTGPTVGEVVQITYTGIAGGVSSNQVVASGTITGYNSTTGVLSVNITTVTVPNKGIVGTAWLINPITLGLISTFQSYVGVFPSNADVWWYFKDSTGTFNPSTTINNVTLSIGNAPKGHIILNAFTQHKQAVSGAIVNDVVTVIRPSVVAWFAGRAWYSGVNASQQAIGDAGYYNWSQNIYFSQVSVNDSSVLGNCYQVNDPTSQELFDILPTDGGVITINECGIVYKLWPLQNGMLVFASNGVWFITGSQGIGFAANDYTVTKISSVKSISSTSFVDVQGLPYFWNEDGIYMVGPSKQGAGGLTVEPLTVGTIQGYYAEIPIASKQYARGDYDPINYNIQWVYRSTQESGTATRYQFDSILNLNTYNKAFYPYRISDGDYSEFINDCKYITYPFVLNQTPEPGFKYACSKTIPVTGGVIGFADEHDVNYVDWGGQDYSSFFITGYSLRGMAIKKFQPQYVQVWHRTNDGPTAYKIQGLWDYSNSSASGRWSSQGYVNTGLSRFDTSYRRHKIRGHGYALQLKISSITGKPFDIQGWAVIDTVNQGA